MLMRKRGWDGGRASVSTQSPFPMRPLTIVPRPHPPFRPEPWTQHREPSRDLPMRTPTPAPCPEP